MKIVQEKVYDEVLSRLKKAYQQIESRIGLPFEENVLYGPLHSKQAVNDYQQALQQIQQVGGKIFYGGQIYKQRKGNYVQPTIITDIQHNTPIVQQETFVPILYVLKCKVKHSFVNSIRLCFLFCLVI